MPCFRTSGPDNWRAKRISNEPIGSGRSEGTVTWGELLEEAAARLGSAHEARRIAETASGHEGAELALHLDDEVTARPGAHFEALVTRRASGEPLQYVLGSWSFRRLDLYIDRRVLIPRPETEVVAGIAIEELEGTRGGGVAVDLGTGSGAIALAIADEVPGVEVWGTDASADALDVARANLAGLRALAASRVRLVEGSWFGALPAELRGRVRLVVSNPPYVADAESLPDEVVKWEPRQALFSGPAGTECIEHIVSGARVWLARPGALVVEIAPHQAETARSFAVVAGYRDVEVRPDLTGRDRVLVARL